MEVQDTSILRGRRAAYFTLGCKLNFAETSAVGQQLKAAGVETAREGERADLCVVNTCSVTEVADAKCRQAIRHLTRQHTGAIVVVTGCYAQLRPEEVSAIDGVDLVLGNEEKGQIVERLVALLSGRLPRRAGFETVPTARIRTFVPSCSSGERTRYFLKVQDGCDYYCTYCTIPYARGRSRNGSVASMVAQAEEVARRGGREIVLTGVNIGDFGRTTGETFLELIQALDRVEGISRYRISSIEPNLLTDDIIAFTAQSRAFMPHFHIPLQSGSDDVLRLMHRRYDTALFRHKVDRIHALMPDAFIGVDVIVGTRGETEALFDEALRFMRDTDVSQYHVFSYSERAGTLALRIPHTVPPEEKHRRSQLVLDLSARRHEQFCRRFIGQTRPVLLEHSRHEGLMNGHTDNYIKVEIETREPLDGEIRPVRLTRWDDEHHIIKGECV